MLIVTLINNEYLECISCGCVIAMPSANTSLLTYQGSHFPELFGIHITVSIKVKHSEGNFEMTPGSCKKEFKSLKLNIANLEFDAYLSKIFVEISLT